MPDQETLAEKQMPVSGISKQQLIEWTSIKDTSFLVPKSPGR
jgi:hypothetical protein